MRCAILMLGRIEKSDGESENNVMNTSQSGLGETVTLLRTQSEWSNNDLPINGGIGPRSGSTYKRPDENRMIGDFDGNDNALWTLYGEKSKSYDEARIGTLKDNMDGVLIFVRSCFVHQLNPPPPSR